MKFAVPHQFLQKRLNIAVVGVGGTGGEVMDALTRLDFGLKALGHPHGIHVTAFDADIVEPHNIGRQRFSQSDVGQYKSIALTHRINMFYGTDWDAEPNFFEVTEKSVTAYDLIIGCVDKAAFRVQLGQFASKGLTRYTPTLWLDMGNGKHAGQCVLGHVISHYEDTLRLPNVFELYPDLANPAHDSDESTLRCSLAEALTGENGQDLFINGTLATYSMNILWQLLTKGEIDHHGMTVDVQSLKSAPMPIDENAWAFYGYKLDKEAA